MEELPPVHAHGVQPGNLISSDTEFYKGIEGHHFNWRWLSRNDGQESFRVLTLEADSSKAPNVEELAKKYLPTNISTVHQNYYPGLENTTFNWRWYNRSEGEDFKVVTIEDTESA